MIALVLALALQSDAKAAHLGLESRAPTQKEGKDLGLPVLVGRHLGQIVESVEKDGPAAKAGLQEGDIVLQLDENKLYSRDELDDFVATAKPGAKVRAKVKRGDKEEDVAVALGERRREAKAVVWEYSGPAQLAAAIEEAKKRRTLVLIGISGAET